MKPVVLIGGGGHCKSVIDVIESQNQLQVAGIVHATSESNVAVLSYPPLGCDDDLAQILGEIPNALITVGQIKSANPRIRLFEKVKELSGFLPVLVSENAYVSNHAEIGEGTVVLHFAMINVNVKVGSNCIINSRAHIEHDVNVAPHCHISTGAILNGGVSVGEGTFIGSGCIVRESVTIGSACIVGAGSVITRDVPGGSLINAGKVY
ncbi:MAG: acetyltransferase [Gammaproteobacteria bacterium]